MKKIINLHKSLLSLILLISIQGCGIADGMEEAIEKSIGEVVTEAVLVPFKVVDCSLRQINISGDLSHNFPTNSSKSLSLTLNKTIVSEVSTISKEKLFPYSSLTGSLTKESEEEFNKILNDEYMNQEREVDFNYFKNLISQFFVLSIDNLTDYSTFRIKGKIEDSDDDYIYIQFNNPDGVNKEKINKIVPCQPITNKI